MNYEANAQHQFLILRLVQNMVEPPAPPDEIMGIFTDSETSLFSSVSKPFFVPSMSIEVSIISPAPKYSTSFAQSITLIPVGSHRYLRSPKIIIIFCISEETILRQKL